MNNAADFLTDEQLKVELTPSGVYVKADGDWAEAETLGSELERFFRNYNEPLLDVVTEFSINSNSNEAGEEVGYAGVSYFMAWTDSYLLIVLDSIFDDQYLAVLPRNPPKRQS